VFVTVALFTGRQTFSPSIGALCHIFSVILYFTAVNHSHVTGTAVTARMKMRRQKRLQ